MASAPNRSTDNSAGAIIVKGMVDRALDCARKVADRQELRSPRIQTRLSRWRLRYEKRYFDILHWTAPAVRPSSSVPTLRSMRVAAAANRPRAQAPSQCCLKKTRSWWIVDLINSGSASDYRIMDFRKPMLRFCGQDRSEISPCSGLSPYSMASTLRPATSMKLCTRSMTCMKSAI